MNGERFDVEDDIAPKTPFRPNCRCTTVPVIEGWESKTRWHRDPTTGKGKIVDHLNFNDWKEKYVTPEVERELKIEKNRSRDKCQFDK